MSYFIEFELNGDILSVIKNRPDVLIQNDKNIKRLKAGEEYELIQVGASN